MTGIRQSFSDSAYGFRGFELGETIKYAENRGYYKDGVHWHGGIRVWRMSFEVAWNDPTRQTRFVKWSPPWRRGGCQWYATLRLGKLTLTLFWWPMWFYRLDTLKRLAA